MPPILSFYNRQRRCRFDQKYIRALAVEALPCCLKAALPGSALTKLAEVEVSIISDEAIAVAHGDFFDDPTPTDVITFHHGELLLGAGRITENARAYGQSPTCEAALCVVHGLLHLGGWLDGTNREAKAMAHRQEQIFKVAQDVVGSPKPIDGKINRP